MAAAPEIVAKFVGKGRKQTVVNDFVTVPTTVLLFRPLTIKPSAVELYCSPTWKGLVLLIDGRFIAINEAATAATSRKLAITLDGANLDVIKLGAKGDPLLGNKDVARKLWQRAERECDKPEPTSTPTAPARNGPGDSLETAYAICSVVDAAGFTSSPCEVSGWNSAVKISADIRGPEARQICDRLIDAMRQNDWPFNDPWTVQVYSPFSGEKTLATCKR